MKISKSLIRLFRASALLIVCITAPWQALLGQANRAIILGRVVDSSGATVQGVAVKVIQESTGVVRNTVTNSSGNYEVPGLFPNVYRVEATLRGFKKSVTNNVPVQSDQRAEINFTLQPGDVAESITVSAGTEILDTADANVNSVISSEKLANLPIGEDNATYLFITVPGAMTGDSVGIGGNGSDIQPIQRGGSNFIRFNGSPEGTTEYTINGDPNTQRGNTGVGGGTSFNLTTDVVEEVRVQTNSFDASIGHTGGATVDVIMKQGTNDYHGTASDKFRRAGWNANGFTNNRTGIPRQNNEFGQWSFTGGGPVRIPFLYNGKNRTFFYYGFERWHSRALNPPEVGTVPLPQQLTGDFSGLLKIGPQYQLYDPMTGKLTGDGRVQRSPFPNNIIPTSRINPTSTMFATLWAAPNLPGTIDGQNDYTADQSPFPRGYKNSTLRLDHNLSDAHKLSGRWLIGRNDIPGKTLFGRRDISPSGTFYKNLSIGVSDVWTLSPSLIADFRVSDVRGGLDNFAAGGDYPRGSQVSLDALGFGSIKRFVNTSTAGFPSIVIPGYSVGTANSFSNGGTSREVSEVRAFSSNWTKVWRDHSFKFGADYRTYIENAGGDPYLLLTFAGGYTTGPFNSSAAPKVGGALTDFLLGYYDSADLRQPASYANLSSDIGIYINDDWKITPRLTVNLGLRYEREGPSRERYNQSVVDFAFNQQNPIAAQVKANYAQNPIPEIPVSNFEVNGGLVFAGNGAPRSPYNSDNNNFAPRIGLAYQFEKNTVFRAGYGMFFIPYSQRFFASEGSVPGFQTDTLSSSTLDGGLTFPNTLQNIFPSGLATPVGSSLGLATALGQSLTLSALPRNKPNAYSQHWQGGLEHVFRDAYKLEVRYVGNRTLKMPIAKDMNALPDAYLSTSPVRDQATIDRLNRLVPNPFFQVAGVSGSLGTSRLISASTLLRPYPEFGTITMDLNQGRTWYDALQIEFSKRFTQGFTLQTSYTFSKDIDQLGYRNAGDVVPERVIGDQNRPQIWRFMGIYELPFGKGKFFGPNVNRAVDLLIGGWQIQGISYVQSGSPIRFQNPLYYGDIHDITIDNPTRERLFNTAEFETDSAKQLASNLITFPSRLAGVRYPHETTTDLSIFKTVKLERFQIQLRVEAYNAFNTHFFNDNAGYTYGSTQTTADTTPTSPTFGATQTASVGRVMQGVLKLVF